MGEPEPAREVAQRSTTGERRRRRDSRLRGGRSGSSGSRRRARVRLRALYFSLAALWGFVAGTAAVLIAVSAVQRPVALGPRTTACVVGAALMTLAGGLVAAAAYGAASRRFR